MAGLNTRRAKKLSLKILCAFQTEEIFEFIKAALQDFQCELVKSTSESLALFLAQKNYPCLIISEKELHGGSGINLLREIKAESDLASIPFVFLVPRPGTTTICPDLPKEELPEGAEMLMWYPIEQHEFIASIGRFLEEMTDPREPETPE